MQSPVHRFDAPFWIALIAGVILVGSIGCLGLALVAQDAARNSTVIVGPDGT